MNNRVKKATLLVYPVDQYHAAQCATTLVLGDMTMYAQTLKFRDSMEFQEFSIPFKKFHNPEIAKQGYVGQIIIEEVYRGTRWKDTCIAEIKVE